MNETLKLIINILIYCVVGLIISLSIIIFDLRGTKYNHSYFTENGVLILMLGFVCAWPLFLVFIGGITFYNFIIKIKDKIIKKYNLTNDDIFCLICYLIWKVANLGVKNKLEEKEDDT